MQQVGQPRETTLRDFMSVVFRRKGVILTVVVAAVATVVLLNARTAPSYLSTARLLVSRGEPESVFTPRKTVLSWEEELNSEIEVLRSTTLGKMAQALLDESKAVNGLGQPIRFKNDAVRPATTGKSSVLVVSYTAPDPREAREALRALTRAYIDWRSETRSPPYVEAFFQTELEALRDQLADWEQRRAEFMADEGIIHIRAEQESLLPADEAPGASGGLRGPSGSGSGSAGGEASGQQCRDLRAGGLRVQRRVVAPKHP
jgi:uncharacterized protein involved in exopolysaccharide biosynthesis